MTIVYILIGASIAAFVQLGFYLGDKKQRKDAEEYRAAQQSLQETQIHKSSHHQGGDHHANGANQQLKQ